MRISDAAYPSIRPVWTVPALMLLAALSSTPARGESVDYRKQIRQLLSDRCYKCHGPDAAERQAGLRLDLRDGATAKLESGAVAVVPGDLAASALVERIKSTDPDRRMPPPASGKSLSDAEIGLLESWVVQGADWKDHWSLLRIERPEPPATDAAMPGNPIDRFVGARLAREGLTFSPPADRVTAIRRLTFDLTGLPPTPEELDAYLNDPSPDAYEKAVDRLLKSTRYGEHFGRYWLDAVRFGDTHGLHLDNERSLWPYRDWVIRAFNDNLPFDRFTIEQLAGDLIPDATLDQKIASGFNRCNVSTSEGGSINEEVLVRYAVDRTEALGTVWMGLTLGCAVCHSHKFDPISQKEFYQLYAFFNAAADAAMDGNALLPPPITKLTSAEFESQFKTIDEQIAQIKAGIADQLRSVQYEEPVAAADAAADASLPREYVWIDDDAPPKAKLEGNSPWEFVTRDAHPVLSGERATRRMATGLSQHFFTGADPGLRVGEGDKLFAYVYLDPANPPKEIMLQWNDGSWEHRVAWGDDVIPWGAAGTPSRVLAGALPKTGEWVRLEVDAAQVGLQPGATINGWAFTQHDGTCFWDKAGIVTRTPQAGMGFESLLAWEAYEKAQSKSSLPGDLQAAIKLEAGQRTPEQQQKIRDYFVEFIYPVSRAMFEGPHQQLAEANKRRAELDNSIPSSMVMADMPQPRPTFVLTRGAYDKPGEAVTADVPAVFPRLPADAPRNRLGLARWLTDPSHPLTARVVVNRFWQQYFGVGLVKTAEDFGAQGDPPTHPELLDWLASEFMQSGWNVKALQKLIVMSTTYRQSSHVRPELLQRDPANELLARGPRFRLDGEVLRDTALFTSGLLVEKQGGRSVRPYQPEGIWEAVAFQGSTTQNYKADSGEGLYRRSLYTFWKRTSPPPSLSTFDAPSRETCTVRRARTNTPLQALVLMNDVQFVEAARKLAERAIGQAPSDPPAAIRAMFRLATSRLPLADEESVLSRLHGGQFAKFAADPEAATKLLAVGSAPRNDAIPAAELAAMTMVANLILNLDESVTKE
jgi:mono/diheme cytochrome c family protein